MKLSVGPLQAHTSRERFVVGDFFRPKFEHLNNSNCEINIELNDIKNADT